MTFHITHRVGGDEVNPPSEAFESLLEELTEDPDDLEHTSVAVTHESGWSVAAYRGGLVTLENVEDLDIPPRHLDAQPDRVILSLFRAVAQGGIGDVTKHPWRHGYEPDSV